MALRRPWLPCIAASDNWGGLPLRAGGLAAPEAERKGHGGVAGDSGVWLWRAGDAGEAMDDAAQELVAVQAGEVRSA